MKRFLLNCWWMFALRGTAALLFGILALAWPMLTLLFFVALFSAYALAIGGVAIIAALKMRREHGWWLVLMLGLASLRLPKYSGSLAGRRCTRLTHNNDSIGSN